MAKPKTIEEARERMKQLDALEESRLQSFRDSFLKLTGNDANVIELFRFERTLLNAARYVISEALDRGLVNAEDAKPELEAFQLLKESSAQVFEHTLQYIGAKFEA